jgi:hypothetical protein
VPGQQPLSQHDQDKGDDCGLQGKESEHVPILIGGTVVEQVESIKFLDVSLPPHSKWYQSTNSRSIWLLNSFYPQAIRILNS